MDNGWKKLLATVGVPTFLLLWLLGGLPFLPSPITARLEAVSALAATHDQRTREATIVLRLICDALWRGDRERQRDCWSRTGLE